MWPGPSADEGYPRLAVEMLPAACCLCGARRGALCGRSEASFRRRQRGIITLPKTWVQALLCSLVRWSVVVALWFSCLLCFYIGGIACNDIQSCELLHCGLWPRPFPCHASPYLSCSTGEWHRTNLEFLLLYPGGWGTLPSLEKFFSWLWITSKPVSSWKLSTLLSGLSILKEILGTVSPTRAVFPNSLQKRLVLNWILFSLSNYACSVLETYRREGQLSHPQFCPTGNMHEHKHFFSDKNDVAWRPQLPTRLTSV